MGWEYPLATLGMTPGYFQRKQRKNETAVQFHDC